MDSEYYRITTGRGAYLQYREETQSYIIVADKVKASVWPKTKATNRLKSLPKHLKSYSRSWRLEPVLDAPTIATEEKVEVIESAEEIDKFNTTCNPSILTHFRYKVPDEVLCWTEAVKSIALLQNKTDERLQELRNKLQEAELERIDIMHIIELDPPLNMYEAWRLYKRLKDNLTLRRWVKDEIKAIKFFVESIPIKDLTESSVDNFIKSLEERKYRIKSKNDIGYDDFRDMNTIDSDDADDALYSTEEEINTTEKGNT